MEYDPVVLSLQKSYFGFDINSKDISSYEMSSELFIDYAIKKGFKYDLIIVDGGPPMDVTDYYTNQTSLLLNEGRGMIWFNSYKSGDWNRPKTNTLKKYFEQVFIIDSRSVNSVLVATNFFAVKDEKDWENKIQDFYRLHSTNVKMDQVLKKNEAAQYIMGL